MKAHNIIITIAALAAFGIVTLLAYRYQEHRATAETCPFCERMVHSVTAYRLMIGGHELAACCPRCGMRAMLNGEQGKTTQARATDFNTGESVDAESATYVEGGDVQYCTHGDHPETREPNGVSVREFDRCLPTLAAFKTSAEAELYQKEHGGRVLSYGQALDSVRKQ
jgi:hypothetical protein